jgi:hypothetical protein
MGSGGGRALPMVQGYRERVLETRLSRRAWIPARWPVTRPDIERES